MKKLVSKRQIEILELMAEGYKEEDIANKLNIAHVTLRRHKTLLYKKLGVNNSVSAVVTAMDLGLIKWELATKYRIERNIEFKSEYLQSGITILNYFSTVLRQKNPDSKSVVRIEQEGLNVRLLIIPEKGTEIQVIEKTLEEYGLVISGKMKMTDFLNDNMQILELENKLEISKLELRFAHKQLEYERKNHEGRITSIENEVDWLRGQIGNSLSDIRKITIGSNNYLGDSVKEHFPSNDKALLKSLDLIEKFLIIKDNEKNKEEMLKALQDIQKKNPAILKFIQEFAQKTISSTSGKLLYDLISSLL
ncbi:LuxR C-terminal-related transcriptional regulator [Tamlana sp. 2201CG12-4]|uniref:response regulator transcription factor n=1 Tax=Tamlana sp. 2201CG12-4 TaxID=3112582 RepID=UPI002DB5E96E|nr:LuxR C-terminal-related transcriptional regulator [Tamlana sp. 2201CG12-4]MEC3905546.1 LuxR C-terminal-related transcriptional regulator [Tamlana sp. 2201CG12-4]